MHPKAEAMLERISGREPVCAYRNGGVTRSVEGFRSVEGDDRSRCGEDSARRLSGFFDTHCIPATASFFFPAACVQVSVHTAQTHEDELCVHLR